MFFTKMCPSSGTKYVSFELFLSILRGLGEGRGGAPGTVPLQNPEVTSRKACLRNAELLVLQKSCFGKRCLFPCPTSGDSDRNGRHDELAFHPRTQGPSSSDSEKDKNDKKKHSIKSMVYRKRGVFVARQSHSEAILLCNRCASNWKINSQTTNKCV